MNRRLVPVCVFLIVLAAFARTLSCDFVYDDWSILVYNPHLNPPTLASLGYYWMHPVINLYMPITGTAWAAIARLAFVTQADAQGNHLNPAAFHSACLLLHAAASVALYRVLLRVLNRPWPAAAGALVFGLHPIQVEAVAFIGAINNPLLALFSFLAIADYLDGSKSASRYRRGLIFLGLALLSKPTAVVVPAIAVILQIAIDHPPAKVWIRTILPYAALAIPFALSDARHSARHECH